MLNTDIANVSSECKKFVEKCYFLPLIISTARSILESEGLDKEEFYKEILNAPSYLPGKDGIPIMQAVLKKLADNSRNALKKIANSGVYQHDITFLRKFIGNLSYLHLQQLNLIASTNIPDVVQVHELICRAVREDVTDSDELVSAIENYISDHQGEMTSSVLREIHLARNEIEKTHSSQDCNEGGWLAYALLQIESERRINLYNRFLDEKITASAPLPKVMCIVDAKESHAYTINEKDRQKEYYESCAEEYAKLLENELTENVRLELLHHLGKALRRSGHYSKSLQCFKELLEIDPFWHAARGQIAHLGIQSRKEKNQEIGNAGEKAISELIDFMVDDSTKVPLRVSLAGIAKLRSYKPVANEIKKDKNKIIKLADIIASSALDGLDQFYEAFVSFSSIFSYEYSEICIDLAEEVSSMLFLSSASIEKRQWVSACEALTNISISAKKIGKEELSRKLSIASLLFADEINLNVELKPYDARAIAKAYLEGNQPRKALDAISKVSVSSVDHWLLYRKTEALVAVKSEDEALACAELALSLAQNDNRAKEYLSSYYSLLADCFEQIGDLDSTVEQLTLAIKCCDNNQYKSTLEERLKQITVSIF